MEAAAAAAPSPQIESVKRSELMPISEKGASRVFSPSITLSDHSPRGISQIQQVHSDPKRNPRKKSTITMSIHTRKETLI